MPSPTQPPTPTPTGAVFFRRSRLFFREAAFFSGCEWCEWGAKQPTVGASGDKAENEFSGFIPLIVPRKGESPHIPASRLFYLLYPTKSTQNPPKIHQKSKIQINPSPKPYIYIMCTHPHQKNQKNICPSPKKALTLHSQNRKRRTCSQAKAGQKPTKSQTAKIFSKKALKICTVQIKVVILHHFRLAKKSFPVSDFFEPWQKRQALWNIAKRKILTNARVAR